MPYVSASAGRRSGAGGRQDRPVLMGDFAATVSRCFRRRRRAAAGQSSRPSRRAHHRKHGGRGTVTAPGAGVLPPRLAIGPVIEGVYSGTHTGVLASPQGDVPPTGRTLKLVLCDVVEIAAGQRRRIDPVRRRSRPERGGRCLDTRASLRWNSALPTAPACAVGRVRRVCRHFERFAGQPFNRLQSDLARRPVEEALRDLWPGARAPGPEPRRFQYVVQTPSWVMVPSRAWTIGLASRPAPAAAGPITSPKAAKEASSSQRSTTVKPPLVR